MKKCFSLFFFSLSFLFKAQEIRLQLPDSTLCFLESSYFKQNECPLLKRLNDTIILSEGEFNNSSCLFFMYYPATKEISIKSSHRYIKTLDELYYKHYSDIKVYGAFDNNLYFIIYRNKERKNVVKSGRYNGEHFIGPYIGYYKNGIIKVKGTYNESDYSKIGVWKFYNKKGKLIKEINYN